MRKKFLIAAAVALAMGTLLCGCKGKTVEEQNELKAFAIAALNEENYEDAIEGFDEALSLASGKVTDREIDICYYKAVAQYLSGDVAAACSTLDDVIAYDEDAADAYYLRGSIYLSEGESERGVADMKKSIESAPDDRERVIGVFSALSGSGEREAGLSIVSEALSKLGDSSDDALWKSRYYLALSQYDEALAALSGVQDAGEAERLLIAGEQSMDGDDYEGALDSFNRGIALYNTDDERALKKLSTETCRRLLSDRVAALEYMGEWSDALKYAREYIAAYPQDAAMVREIKFLATR